MRNVDFYPVKRLFCVIGLICAVRKQKFAHWQGSGRVYALCDYWCELDIKLRACIFGGLSNSAHGLIGSEN